MHRLYLALLLSVVPFPSVADNSYQVIPLQKTGTIKGSVKFPGETPPRSMLVNTVDPGCPSSVPQDNLVVTQQVRGLQNALVVLEIEEGKAHGSRQTGLVFKQCSLTPRVQWAPSASSLVMYSEDEVDHHVVAVQNGIALFDVIVPTHQAIRRPLLKEGMYEITCRNHYWEKSWMYVSDHPYVAVTDVLGNFQIHQVPPGKYLIRAWHEGWEKIAQTADGVPVFQSLAQSQTVIVRKNQTTEVVFQNLGPSF